MNCIEILARLAEKLEEVDAASRMTNLVYVSSTRISQMDWHSNRTLTGTNFARNCPPGIEFIHLPQIMTLC